MTYRRDPRLNGMISTLPEEPAVRSYRIARSFDGMISASPEGRTYRVVEPAWWQPWRWLGLWRASERGMIGVRRDGKIYRVHVVRHKPPPRVPEFPR